MLGTQGAYDYFDYALAAGDFDDDGYDDLAIGVPGQTISSQSGAGMVVVADGSASGLLTGAGSFVVLTQAGIAGLTPETGDRFGAAIAAGQLNRPSTLFDFSTDLAVGAPFEDLIGDQVDVGLVQNVFGSGSGLGSGHPPQVLTTAGLGVTDFARGDGSFAGVRWGDALAIADLDQDGYGDLVVGMPHQRANALTNAGAVDTLFGALFADGFERGTTSGWSLAAP